ncbi:hypothetical protein ACLOJK_015552 [Asimina triloba]
MSYRWAIKTNFIFLNRSRHGCLLTPLADDRPADDTIDGENPSKTTISVAADSEISFSSAKSRPAVHPSHRSAESWPSSSSASIRSGEALYEIANASEMPRSRCCHRPHHTDIPIDDDDDRSKHWSAGIKTCGVPEMRWRPAPQPSIVGSAFLEHAADQSQQQKLMGIPW